LWYSGRVGAKRRGEEGEMAESQFEDIKIVALDDAASEPSGEGALMRIVLKLSASAPAVWAEHFNQAWHQHLYMMKRWAAVSGGRLEILCMPPELEADHIPELSKVIAQTNDAYRAFAAEQARQQQAVEEEALRQKQQLSVLKGRLKFD
jgi:hypothetical protein